MTHTPGPWHVDKSHVRSSVNAGDKHIAMVNWWKSGKENDVYGKEHEANALLIAAAPQMLKALEDLVNTPASDKKGIREARQRGRLVLATAKDAKGLKYGSREWLDIQDQLGEMEFDDDI